MAHKRYVMCVYISSDFFSYPVIQYRYTQLDYSFNETDEDSQVCLEIVSGVFVEGGYLTLALFTSPLTATGQYVQKSHCEYMHASSGWLTV